MILFNVHYRLYIKDYYDERKFVEVLLSLKELPEERPKDIKEGNEYGVIESITIDFYPDAKVKDGIFRQGKYKGDVQITSSHPFFEFFWKLPEETQLKIVQEAEAFLIKENL